VEEILVGLAAVAALVYVVSPLGRGPRTQTIDPGRLEEAEARKHSALSAIIDLEAERDAGKLSEDDFETLHKTAEAEALAALAEADLIASADVTDEELEREIAEMREKLACPSCGSMRAPGELCARCGA
jgi:3-hydroxyacyl-CoA dehydrogenase